MLGPGAQLANGMRPTEMARDIALVNRADYALLVLLAETSDRDRVVRSSRINEECLAYVGKSVYAMPGRSSRSARLSISGVARTLWWLLISDPPALGRALLHIPRLLLPWLPEYLGVVEGGNNDGRRRARRP